jgi:PadR family transcriptional regulator, regulatory protein PadR
MNKLPMARLELLQGTLDLIILQALVWGPRHGYGISQMIRTRSEELLRIETGSLYPALHRLEGKGLIVADWATSENNQRVKKYRLTAAGRKRLLEERTRWERLCTAMANLLESPHGDRA